MKRWLYIMLVALCTVACSKGDDPSLVVAHTAKAYYDYLLQGKYDDFVAGMNFPDSIPDTYRSQLVDNAKMYMAQQNREHRGIQEIAVIRARVDTVTHTADAFLSFTYGDGSSEQVVVPMVQRRNIWYMR